MFQMFMLIIFPGTNDLGTTQYHRVFDFSSNRAPRVGECIAVTRFDPDASARVADVECGAATDEDDLLSFTLLNTRTGNILNLIN